MSTAILDAATISVVYQPTVRFLAQTEHAAAPPLGALLPLDACSLLQIARFLPQPPQVIDLAAAATNGATALIWVSNRQAIQAAQIVVDATGRAARSVATIRPAPALQEYMPVAWRKHIRQILGQKSSPTTVA